MPAIRLGNNLAAQPREPDANADLEAGLVPAQPPAKGVAHRQKLLVPPSKEQVVAEVKKRKDLDGATNSYKWPGDGDGAGGSAAVKNGEAR